MYTFKWLIIIMNSSMALYCSFSTVRPDKFPKCTTCEKCSSLITLKWLLTTKKFIMLLTITSLTNFSNNGQDMKNSDKSQVLRRLSKDSEFLYKQINH